MFKSPGQENSQTLWHLYAIMHLVFILSFIKVQILLWTFEKHIKCLDKN